MSENHKLHAIHRKLATASKVFTGLFSHGIADLLRNPKAAKNYWDRIAVAALGPSTVEEDNNKLLTLPIIHVDQISPDLESVPATIIDYQYVYGDMPIHELMILCRIVRYIKPSIIFEIGTYLGGTTLQLAANSQADVYTLDLPPPGHNDYVPPQIWDPKIDVYPDHPGIRFQDSPHKKRIHQLFGDSLAYDFTPYHGKVDIVLVDGCHHYKFLLRDSLNALKMLAHRGIVLWHDYGPYYVQNVVRCLNELSSTLPLFRINGTSLVIYNK